jgi:hypothetical protein
MAVTVTRTRAAKTAQRVTVTGIMLTRPGPPRDPSPTLEAPPTMTRRLADTSGPIGEVVAACSI